MWAAALNPKGLSQGDILRDVPTGTAWRPIVYLGRDAWPQRGTLYYPKRDALEQFKNDPGGLFIAKGRVGRVIVVTHNCDLDDTNDTARILVAPIALISNISHEEARQRILAGVRRTFVPLPGVPGIGDCYADLRSIGHVDRAFATDAQRECSMNDDAVVRLRAQLIDYFTRLSPQHLAGALHAGLVEENKVGGQD